MERVAGGPSKSSSMLFQPFWTTRTFKSPLLCIFGPFGPNLEAPCSSKLVQKLWLGPPPTRSTFVPCCSNRFGQPEPSNRYFQAFLAHLARFRRPWAKFEGALLLQIGPKTLAWTSHSPLHLCTTLFQPFGTNRTFKPPFWAFLANLGRFWASLGLICHHPVFWKPETRT